MAYTTIDNPELYFQAKAFAGTGTGGSTTAVTLDGSEDMSPNLVFVSHRNANGNWRGIADTVRGTGVGLHSNSTDGQATSSEYLTAFGSDGFTVGENGSWGANGVNYVAYCWKESATAGFDIVDYDGAGAANHSHSLSAVPNFMIVKRYSATESWFVYNGNLGQAKVGYLNDTVVFGNGANVWGGSDPTSSVFSIGSDSGISGSGDYIAYLWADKQGFSKTGGTYIGNGNVDGPFVWTGFRPAFVMAKCSTTTSGATGSWYMFDNKRIGYNIANYSSKANDTDAEATSTYLDFVSNGFKIRNAAADLNSSGQTFVFTAFAEQPFVNSNGVPCNAR